MLPVIDIGHDLFLGGTVASELVGDHHPRLAILLDQLAQKTLGSLPVAPFLNHDVQNVAMLINRTPEIENLAADLDHNLIKVPLVVSLRWITRLLGFFHLLGLPVPRKKFVESLSRMFCDAFEDVGEPGLRVDIV